MTARKIPLTLVTAPAIGVVLGAPPMLMASENSVDYACGRCAAVLLHADEGSRDPDPLHKMRIVQFD